METKKRKTLEGVGWKFGDAEDFLDMSAEERQLLETGMNIAEAIKRRREAMALSQKEPGARMKTSQPRIARIERAASDVSLDQLLRTFTVTGGKIVVKTAKAKSGESKGTQLNHAN